MAESMELDQPADHGTLTVEDLPSGLRQITVHTETTQLDPNTQLPVNGRPQTTEASFQFQPRPHR
jgi:redox-sensitive bicupin YhaK (pirin superfamily)